MTKKFIQLTTKVTLEDRDYIKRFFPPGTPDYQILREVIRYFKESKEKEAKTLDDKKIFEGIRSTSERIKKQDELERQFDERMEGRMSRSALDEWKEEALENSKEGGNSVTTTGNITIPQSSDQTATEPSDKKKNNREN